MQPTPTPESHEPQPRELFGVSATGKAFGCTPQNIQARLKRGSFPLQPVARAGKRLFFDAQAVLRAAVILNQPTK